MRTQPERTEGVVHVAATSASERPLLTVIIPVYNEERTICDVVCRVLNAPYEKQIIIVDDGSADGTLPAVREYIECSPIELYCHPVNRGKGAAIRTGSAYARGRYCIVQDADLEYDPADYPRLIEPLRRGEAQVVYGSRYRSERFRWRWFRLGVCVLNAVVRLIYGARLTDEATCYKAMSTELLRELDLRCERFEFCPEVTAQLCRLGIPIIEVPISYRPRSWRDGKKIRIRDGWEALRTLWRYRRWSKSADIVHRAPPPVSRCAPSTLIPQREMPLH